MTANDRMKYSDVVISMREEGYDRKIKIGPKIIHNLNQLSRSKHKTATEKNPLDTIPKISAELFSSLFSEM